MLFLLSPAKSLDYDSPTPPALADALTRPQFLDDTAGIDYDAKTSGASKTFVDAAYEAKPPLWKMGYRAGKETTEAARAFAKEWMEELPTR